MTMRGLALLIVALSVMLAAPSGAAEKVTVGDIFELWNGCQSVGIVVEDMGDDAQKIGLRRKDIRTAVLSGLRGTRIHIKRYADANAWLYARVSVSKSAFSVQLQLRRLVKILSTKDPVEAFFAKDQVENPLFVRDALSHGKAATWETGVTGTHGGNSRKILYWVTKQTDEFVDEYLRVNRKSCEKRSPVR